MLVIRAGMSEHQTGKALIRLLLQKQSDFAVCLGLFARQIVFEILEHLTQDVLF